MKAIILAAGQGTRLRPLTDDRPKCMVPIGGTTIVDVILDTMKAAGIEDITVIGGYKVDVLAAHLEGRGAKVREFSDYAQTNMVSTLFSASAEFNDDVVISYADIIYSRKILEDLMASAAGVSTVVDKDWRKLWELRMEDPTADAESMILTPEGNIVELGKKISDPSKVQGQYIGLTKFSKEAAGQVVDFYNGLDRSALYDGKTFPNMYMTSFLQNIIDRLMPVKAVFANGGWLEVDTLSDLKAYEDSGYHKGIIV